MRRLVTLRTVSALEPIEGADKIELAHIDGWQCVVKKGEFHVGQQGLYFEIDSFIPVTEEPFTFLQPRAVNWNGKYGARIKTMKLRGALSQGLLMPKDLFPNLRFHKWGEKDYASDLGVVKWEREDADGKPKQQTSTWLGRKIKKLKHTRIKPFVLWLEKTFPSWFLTNATRPFPSFIPKTDEERIQNLYHKLTDEHKAKLMHWSVKLDGSSMTVYYNRGKFGVCSRNLDLKKDPENKFWATALWYEMDKGLKKLGRNIAIQGELMGPGIQGNREKLIGYMYYVYGIWDIDEKRYLAIDERAELLGQLHVLHDCNLTEVPTVGYRQVNEFKDLDEILAFAEGPSLHADTREGVVATYIDGTKGFKVISNTFLLEKGE